MEKDWKCTPSIDASSQVDAQGGIGKVNEEKGLFGLFVYRFALVESR